MAQQITIDIVAETKKLTAGVNDANAQLEGMNGKLKGIVSAAGAAASAFVLKEGVTFLKQGVEEAKEAQAAMRAATSTFGEGSAALQKITTDAEKFGKEIAVDNDVILELATSLGSRLPADVQGLSAELVNLGFDVEAFTGGAVSAESMTNKLAKAFADGKVKATELQKIIPGLEQATYDQAAALSEAGDQQGALTLLINEAQKKYGDAAESNVTASQKFETALNNLKETVGTKILPIVEKFVDGLTTIIDKFSSLPGPVQNVILGLLGIVAIGGPLLGFLASAKTSLATLGITSSASATGIGLSTIALNALKFALAGLGIGLVIAAIVLLVKNWDDITAAVGRVWEKIKEVVPKAWEKVKEFKDKVVGFVKDIIDAYLSIPGKMFEIGKDIVKGLWNGITSLVGWLKEKVGGFFKNLLPGWAEKALGISSPSKVFAEVGKNIIGGLASTFNVGEAAKAITAKPVRSPNRVPVASMPSFGGAAPINVTINAGLGTDPVALGRQVNNALSKYGKVSPKVKRG